MKAPKFLFFVFCFLVAQFLRAQNNSSSSDSTAHNTPRFFWGAYTGVFSTCTMGRTGEKLEMNFGYKQLAFTGRFYRTWSHEPYFYENSIEAGWKKKFGNGLSNTASGGYADLAFENAIINRFTDENSPENYHKRSGLILEDKFCYNFHWRNQAPSVCGIATNYYCILNSQKIVQGWAVGIDFTIEDNYWKDPRRKTKRKRIVTYDPPPTEPQEVVKEKESIKYKYRIRTNFITGMFSSPHLDFEHRDSNHWGWGFGFFYRRHKDELWGLVSNNPDIQLSGYGGFVDWIYFKPIKRNDHYWTFGLRCGYRYLAGTCWYGEKLYEPDFLIDRKRQDIVTAERVSFVMPPRNSHWSLDWYFTIGARTSFYKTSPPEYAPSYFNPNANFPYPKTGCYVLPELTGGLEFGFGW